MRVREWDVFTRAVEEAIAYGITRLWKHHEGETMTQEQMREGSQRLEDAVTSGVCEYFEFDEGGNDDPTD